MRKTKTIAGGQSGASIELLQGQTQPFVRKYFTDKARDLLCIKKQQNNDTNLLTPKILNIESSYFDQDFIYGTSGAEIYQVASPSDIRKLAREIDIYLEQKIQQQVPIEFDPSIYLQKIASIRKYCISPETCAALKLCYELCREIKSTLIGPCHGDLTLSNIIVAHEIYIIDFLDTFQDSVLKDASKLNQELMTGWSGRYLRGDDKVRANQIARYLSHNIDNLNFLKTKYQQQILLEDLLTLLRILPYSTSDKHTNDWINISLSKRVQTR